MRSSDVSSTSRKGCGRLTPALLTRMSRRLMSANAARIVTGSVTSKGRGLALPPADLISPATSSSSAGERLLRTSSAPAAARASATPRPSPRPAPVTSATLPSRRKGSTELIKPPRDVIASAAKQSRAGCAYHPSRLRRRCAPRNDSGITRRVRRRGLRARAMSPDRTSPASARRNRQACRECWRCRRG